MIKTCLELVHTSFAYILSQMIAYLPKEWRSEVSYRMMILVRTAIAVLDFPSSGVKLLDLSELEGDACWKTWKLIYRPLDGGTRRGPSMK
jgi:hypothetical protein